MLYNKIYLLRHAEKPDENGNLLGLLPNGRPDLFSLTIRGWQRARALAASFGATETFPDQIYASAFRPGGGHSRRPEQTVLPFAERCGREVILTWALGQELAIAAALTAHVGTALVAWQHEGLPALARAIVAPKTLNEIPEGWVWPSQRYDVVWSLTRETMEGPWVFKQISQRLLAGDSDAPFDL